jgi:hypothetical protein
MNIEIRRTSFGPEFTEGELYVDGSLLCYTLEDAVRDTKVYGKTAIPCGRYRLTVTMSNRFKRRMILVNDVPNFEGVRIHAGNTAADTHGCPLVGMVKTSPNDGFIGESRRAEAKVFNLVDSALMRGEEVWLDVTDARALSVVKTARTA